MSLGSTVRCIGYLAQVARQLWQRRQEQIEILEAASAACSTRFTLWP